jgi:tetratricopeptide (TPR) repeat protein
LQVDPHAAEAWNNIGAAHGAMQQWDAAIRDEQQALRLKPNLVIAQNNLRWYTQQRAAASHPQKALDYLNQSVVLNRGGDYAASLTAARHAVALDPKLAEGWNNIAAADASLHRWDDAMAAAQKAIALKPDFQLAKNNLAWAASQKAAGVR